MEEDYGHCITCLSVNANSHRGFTSFITVETYFKAVWVYLRDGMVEGCHGRLGRI